MTKQFKRPLGRGSVQPKLCSMPLLLRLGMVVFSCWGLAIMVCYSSVTDIISIDVRRGNLPTTSSSSIASFNRKCLNCTESCEGLWKANTFSPLDNKDPDTKRIHIVISHCKNDLWWLSNFTKGHDIASTHVITKCGIPVEGAPDSATIQVLPNVGRCDHTYAYYINKLLDQKIVKGEEKDSIVVFLKDDMSQENFHQVLGGKWRDLDSLIRLASSTNGFGCGVELPDTSDELKGMSPSAYHDTSVFFEFRMHHFYGRNEKGYTKDGVEFFSNYTTLGPFYRSLVATEPTQEVMQVCFGGIFAVSYLNIKKVDSSVFQKAEKLLSRGDNIQEGHYMERSWASLFATPLQQFQISALRKNTKQISKRKYRADRGMLWGAKPKVRIC